MKVWKVITDNGVIAKVWQRNKEIWEWSVAYIDGSGRVFDWHTSYRSAANAAKSVLAGRTDQRPLPRFKYTEERKD